MDTKQIFKLAALSAFFFLFWGCEGDVPEIEKKQEISIIVRYKDNLSDEIRNDIGSKIYIYHGILKVDILNYKLDDSEDGKLLHELDDSKSIMPDKVETVDHNGVFSVVPDPGIEKILFLVASNHYKDEGLKVFFSRDLTYFQEKQTNTIVFSK